MERVNDIISTKNKAIEHIARYSPDQLIKMYGEEGGESLVALVYTYYYNISLPDGDKF